MNQRKKLEISTIQSMCNVTWYFFIESNANFDLIKINNK